jgi:adenylate kinase family enzyme
MRYNTFILFGAPGSGKGTQGKTLGTIPRYYHCACGDVFRSIDTRTKVGKAFLEYSSKGQLVPDDITVELWREAIDAAVEAHKFKPDIDTLVLDGIPRNVGQAKIMGEMIDVKKSVPSRLSEPRDPLLSAQKACLEGQPPGRRKRASDPTTPRHLRKRIKASAFVLLERPRDRG